LSMLDFLIEKLQFGVTSCEGFGQPN